MFRLGFPALLVFVGVLFAGLMFYETRPISGRVIDTDGNPVFHAEVQLQKLFGEEMFSDSWRWKDNQYEPVFTQEDGSFLVPFPREGGDFRLLVDHLQYPLSTKEVEMGESGVEVQLSTPWAITGKVFWDTSVISDTFVIGYEPEHSPRLYSRSLVPSFVAQDNTFRIGALPAGKGTLFIGGHWLDQSFSRLEIDLPPGGGIHDVGTIDTRGKVQKVSVTVLNEAGEIEGGSWAVTLDGKHRNYWRGETLDMYYSGSSVSFEIHHHGSRLLVMEDVTSNQRVTVQKGIPVEIEFEPIPWFPEDLWVDVDFIFQRENAEEGGLSNFSTSSIWELPAPGRYKVMVALQDFDKYTEASMVPMTYVTTEADAPVITVLDQKEVQIFKLDFDEDVIRDALRRLRHLEWPKD